MKKSQITFKNLKYWARESPNSPLPLKFALGKGVMPFKSTILNLQRVADRWILINKKKCKILNTLNMYHGGEDILKSP